MISWLNEQLMKWALDEMNNQLYEQVDEFVGQRNDKLMNL